MKLDICPQCGEFGEMSNVNMCIQCARKFTHYVGEMLG